MKEIFMSGRNFGRTLMLVSNIKDKITAGEEAVIYGREVYQMKEILMSQGIITVIEPAKEKDSFTLKLKS